MNGDTGIVIYSGIVIYRGIVIQRFRLLRPNVRMVCLTMLEMQVDFVEICKTKLKMHLF